ncbi:DUF4259 domain-containing protein [Actinomadura parmotrematis]|uniref:DUF4259 domain-containing protein n=1 Tax=Actinomadura parmotrematis TaxID=2864039 RepID=A0ABS7FT90_9ACTN|nr:DUF4259 domain-containing protein [Actinomadura parmotrematis]MBW8483618.1 DUF4259 domain-containing protein [Actinomadura parmotrematis]
MGTWGTGPFDNDRAADFSGDLDEVAEAERSALIRWALEAAADAEGGLDASAGDVAIAAAALVAAQCPGGAPVTTVYGPDEPVPVLHPEIYGIALRALARVTSDDSELPELWGGEEQGAEWFAVVRGLAAVLEAAPRAPEISAGAFFWDEFFWKAHLVSEGGGPATRISAELIYAPEGREDGPLTDAEHAAIAWTVAHLPALWNAARPAVLAEFRDARDDLGDEAREGSTLTGVNIHPLSKGGMPYVGLQFACGWDEEHGTGVLMHGTRVVRRGGADTAVLLWMAEQDLKSADA